MCSGTPSACSRMFRCRRAVRYGGRDVKPPHADPASDTTMECTPPTATSTPPNSMELMICAAARLLEDGAMVVVGTGAPCAAAMLAQKTTAPRLTPLFEAGGVGPLLPRMPISVGDSRTFCQALMATSMADIMETCQRGLIEYTFL